MAYDRQFLRLTWGFTVDASEEIANTSLNFALGAGSTLAVEALNEIDFTTPLVPEALIGDLAGFMGTSGLNWASYSKLRTIRIAAVGFDGLELAPALLHEDTTPAFGTSTNTLPQASVVVTMRSGLTTGSANTGRMYMPHCYMTLNTGEATASSGTATVFAGLAATFVNAVTDHINASTTDNWAPTIMTNKTGQASKFIDRVSVGTVNDTQRRRRNRLPEVYSTTLL